MNCIGAVLEGMIKQGHGHIINMSSDAGRRGFAGLAVYSGTKFFIEGLSQGMRHELAQSGVKVACVQPGDVKTELLSHSTDQEVVSFILKKGILSSTASVYSFCSTCILGVLQC